MLSVIIPTSGLLASISRQKNKIKQTKETWQGSVRGLTKEWKDEGRNGERKLKERRKGKTQQPVVNLSNYLNNGKIFT